MMVDTRDAMGIIKAARPVLMTPTGPNHPRNLVRGHANGSTHPICSDRASRSVSLCMASARRRSS